MKEFKNQSGQIIVILLLIIVVAMSVGISIIGRSATEISTSNKVEDSARAFFAAEAGIERAIINNGSITGTIPLNNDSQISGVTVLDGPTSGQAVEYPTLDKKDFAQVWFLYPYNAPCSQNCSYNQSSFILYFGNDDLSTGTPTPSKPAIEVDVVTQDNNGYTSTRVYYDSDSTRALQNNFQQFNNRDKLRCTSGTITVNTIIKSSSTFFCQVAVSGYPTGGNNKLILARIRILYVDGQKVAIGPLNGTSLPLQTKTYVSIGKSGNAQRVLRVVKENNVVPPLFDYSIFSTAQINKT